MHLSSSSCSAWICLICIEIISMFCILLCILILKIKLIKKNISRTGNYAESCIELFVDVQLAAGLAEGEPWSGLVHLKGQFSWMNEKEAPQLSHSTAANMCVSEGDTGRAGVRGFCLYLSWRLIGGGLSVTGGAHVVHRSAGWHHGCLLTWPVCQLALRPAADADTRHCVSLRWEQTHMSPYCLIWGSASGACV